MKPMMPVLLFLAATSSAPAQEPSAEALVREGRELVRTYCSTCHNIDPAGGSPHPEAPPFRKLHERYDVETLAESLVEGLITGHPDMPEFTFEPMAAAAIIAYLKSLE